MLLLVSLGVCNQQICRELMSQQFNSFTRTRTHTGLVTKSKGKAFSHARYETPPHHIIPTKSPFSLTKSLLLSPETRVILANGKK